MNGTFCAMRVGKNRANRSALDGYHLGRTGHQLTSVSAVVPRQDLDCRNHTHNTVWFRQSSRPLTAQSTGTGLPLGTETTLCVSGRIKTCWSDSGLFALMSVIVWRRP